MNDGGSRYHKLDTCNLILDLKIGTKERRVNGWISCEGKSLNHFRSRTISRSVGLPSETIRVVVLS